MTSTKYIERANFEARFLRAVYSRIVTLKTAHDQEEIEKIKLRISAILDLAEELLILSEEHCSYLWGEVFLTIETAAQKEVCHV